MTSRLRHMSITSQRHCRRHLPVAEHYTENGVERPKESGFGIIKATPKAASLVKYTPK